MSLEKSTYNTLSNVYKTVIEMLNDRHYNTSEYSNQLSIEDIKKKYLHNNLEIIVKHNNNQKQLIILFYNEKFGISDVNKLIEYLKEKKLNNVILVVKEKLTSFGLKALKNSEINYEIFLRKNLMFNITKHILVPKHIILSKDEKNKLLKTLQCKLDQLPKILKTDPISKYFNALTGQVFKIYRKNEIYYRVVV
jgi:DNA-directed RNA polymerases I, II, and III subunit RPABC1